MVGLPTLVQNPLAANENVNPVRMVFLHNIIWVADRLPRIVWVVDCQPKQNFTG
jgi:hypothetical protein